MEKTKICKKCLKPLPFNDFPKDSRSKDGKWRFCRACESARKKELRQKLKAAKPTEEKTTKTINKPTKTEKPKQDKKPKNDKGQKKSE